MGYGIRYQDVFSKPRIHVDNMDSMEHFKALQIHHKQDDRGGRAKLTLSFGGEDI